MRWIERWIELSLVMVLGCGSAGGSESDPDESSTLTDPVAVDSGSVVDPPWQMCGAGTPTEFEVVNEGESNLYLQRAGYPGTSLMSLRHEGEPVRAYDCGWCRCLDCPSCAVCGRAPTVLMVLEPGQSHRVTWDGLDHRTLDDGSSHNTCDSSCSYPCGLGPGTMTASVTYSDWFSTLFAPDVISQGIAGEEVIEFLHPAESSPRIELTPPPDPVEPRMTATTPDGGVETTYVVASINPSDNTEGLEIAALYGASAPQGTEFYVGMFAPAEEGTHPLTEGMMHRRVVTGVQGSVDRSITTEGSVTIERLSEDAVEGSFEFTTDAGRWSGTFVAPLRR